MPLKNQMNYNQLSTIIERATASSPKDTKLQTLTEYIEGVKLSKRGAMCREQEIFDREFEEVWKHAKSKGDLDFVARLVRNERLAKGTRRDRKRFYLQAEDESEETDFGIEEILIKVRSCMTGDIASLMEDLFLTCAQVARARSRADVFLAVLTFAKLRTKGSLLEKSYVMIRDFLKELFPVMFTMQSGDEWLEGVTNFRGFLGKYEDLKDSKIVAKIGKLCNFLVGYGCFSFVGLDPSEQSVKLKDIGRNPMQHANFLYCIVDTVSLTIQRCLMFVRTGDWDVFVHGPKTYGDWYDLCMRLKREATGMGNLEAHGTNFHKFVSEVKTAIEQGSAIVKFHTSKDGAEFRAARTMLSDIQMINATIITKKSAQQERRAPFSVLVHGGSSVAKSHFSKMLFYYYAKLYNLPIGDEFRYTRNSCDKFWSGFATQAWCILMDDIAFRSATSTVEDISLGEMINVINNVPFNPPQGELADKGKTPLRAEFVVATTNAKTLNAEVHFHCPLAILRRLPWVITLRPKPEFCRVDAPSMICPVKMMEAKQNNPGWPDFWIITVEKVVPGGDLDGKGRQTAVHEEIAVFSDVNKFLDWFKEITMLFKTQQQSAMEDDDKMAEMTLCATCNRTICECMVAQSTDEVERPPGIEENQGWESTELFLDGTHVTKYHFVPPIAGQPGKWMAVHTTTKTNGDTRKWVSPVRVVGPVVKMQCDSVEYADVMDVILRRQMEQTNPNKLARVVGSCVRVFLATYMESPFFRSIVDTLLGYKITRKIIVWAVKSYAPAAAASRKVFEAIGKFAQGVYMSKYWRTVVKGLAVLGGVALGYKAVKGIATYFGSEGPAYEEQGARMSVTESHFMKDEKEAVWKNNRDHTTPLDLAPASLNPSMTPEMLEKRIMRNMARICIKRGPQVMRPGNMFCVGGHLWATDLHLFEGEAPFTIKIMFEPEGPGVSSNRIITVHEGSLYRQPELDRMWLWLPDINVRAVMHTLFMKETLQGTVRGRYVGFDPFVQPKSHDVCALSRKTVQPTGFERPYPYWMGKTSDVTQNGDCGKVLISTDPHCAILGLHQMGSTDGHVGAVILTQESCQQAIDHFAQPLISPGVPKLETEDRPKVLGPLHEKSPIRWIKQGSIIHYGSFQGYRRVPRSKVNYTLLGERILLEREWKVNYGRPDLKDWAAYHHALKDITSQTCNVDAGLVNHCVESFANDIIKGLSEKSMNDLQKVHLINAINGVPGVAHLDKMNLATSMGEPWCTSKKAYLVPMPTDTIPHAKIFTKEVMDRISRIEEDYLSGTCANPVFSGQKKDEARAIEKLVEGKIRIFTGGPVDHSVVVRSYLHTFTKVMTENKLLFETGIGCAAQTLEWEQFYDYLTQFGLDRMVAGDYEKFDKKMGAIWILAAFQVIILVLKASGWTEEEVLPIHCIAEDTAHPLVNLGGDLLRTYGMNPSGHTLTVIINSIVNSLYLRYAYARRSPDKMCLTFKLFVALLTYGDDNVMGVSVKCTWFNHTTIVEEMAAIGVGYTMADKKTASVPFIHMSGISFLKRSWVYDTDIGAWVCPLEMESVYKMQVMCVEGNTISRAQHQLEVFHAALGEYFFHGKELFESERIWMVSICEVELPIEHELKPFPTYDELRERFWKNSDGIVTERLGRFAYVQ